MAPQSDVVSLALLVAILFVRATSAQTNNTCSIALLQLSSCLEYTTGAVKQPSPMCCSGLASVVKSEPSCLCSVIGGGRSGFDINETLALQLPRACNVQTPPASQCKSAASPNAPQKSSEPQGRSKAAPLPDNSKASGSVVMPLLLVLFTSIIGSSTVLSV